MIALATHSLAPIDEYVQFAIVSTAIASSAFVIPIKLAMYVGSSTFVPRPGVSEAAASYITPTTAPVSSSENIVKFESDDFANELIGEDEIPF